MFPFLSIKMIVKEGSIRWQLFWFLIVGVTILDASSNGTLKDTTLMNGKLESTLDARCFSCLIPIKQRRFSRRITAFQRANQRKNARQRLPAEVVPIVANYIYYDWMNLVTFFEDRNYKYGELLTNYLVKCEKAGPEALPWPGYTTFDIQINSAGELITIILRNWKFGRSVLGEGLHLPPTLIDLGLRGNFVSHLETRILPRGLEHLDLSFNFLQTLDFGKLPRRLRSLCLDYNPLTDLDFSALPKGLKRLDLQGLGLKEFEVQWLPEELETLDLSHNQLETLNLTDPKSLSKVRLYGQPRVRLHLPPGATQSGCDGPEVTMHRFNAPDDRLDHDGARGTKSYRGD